MAPIAADHESEAVAKAIGRTIRSLREEKGVSQEKFSELTGHHRTYIGFLERGERTPNVVTLKKVASALGLRTSELLAKAGL
jgi:transcriptional regulator with XRE-family HTH domain